MKSLEKRLSDMERAAEVADAGVRGEPETIIVLPDNGRGDVQPGRYGNVVIEPRREVSE